jgi:MFS family permease
VTGLSFYGLLLNLENLTGNIFIDSLVSYTGELFAEIYSGYLANKHGKSVLMYSLAINSVGSLALTLFNSIYAKIPLLFMASIGIASGFNVLYIFTPQYYPTNIRAVALSFFSLSNRVAAGCVPLLLNFMPNINFIIGCISAFGVVVVMFIPEVKGYNAGSEVAEKRIVKKHTLHSFIRKNTMNSRLST